MGAEGEGEERVSRVAMLRDGQMDARSLRTEAQSSRCAPGLLRARGRGVSAAPGSAGPRDNNNTIKIKCFGSGGRAGGAGGCAPLPPRGAARVLCPSLAL